MLRGRAAASEPSSPLRETLSCAACTRDGTHRALGSLTTVQLERWLDGPKNRRLQRHFAGGDSRALERAPLGETLGQKTGALETSGRGDRP